MKPCRLAHAVSNVLLTSLAACLLIAYPRTAQAQDENAYCGSDDYLKNLPVNPPKDPNTKRQVQLVNCSDQVVLGAANAARSLGQPPWPVFPQEGTWVMQPFNPKNPTDYSNVLTIDVPPEWYGQHVGGNTGNFWVRTGCRYDAVANRAQCETGGCGGQYDCSSANISPPPATTIVEWTFYQPFDAGGPTYYFDSPDISAVNGASLTVDVSPKGGDAKDPLNEKDWHWLNWNYPLTVHGKDLREPTQCVPASGSGFKVARSAIDETVDSHNPGYPLLGYVTVDDTGAPTMPSGNNLLACLSNCAKYKFPTELGATGCNTKTDANCYFWTTFCAGNDSINYGKRCQTGIGDGTECNTDADCLKCNGGTDYHIACFQKAGPSKLGSCDLRGFFKATVSDCNGQAGTKCGPAGSQCAAPTSTIACTNTYGSINPLDSDLATKFDYSDQPIIANCSVVTFNGTEAACVGEDTLHQVLHGAYTWPNDPQVYQSDAPVYRMVFSPEGRGQAPITPAQPLPACDNLPSNYKPSSNRNNCSIPITGQNADFAIGLVCNQTIGKCTQWQSTGSDWPCFVPERTAADNGVLCEWDPLPQGANCRAPKTDSTYVTSSACGRIDSGTSLLSGSMTPSTNDPLFVEVSIPKVLNNVSLPSSISGCAASWTPIASQFVNTNQGVVAWYKGTSNTSSACQVTVTLASENPAEVKVYDVPKFNGTVETMSTLSGAYTDQPLPYTISAGTTTTNFSNDLQLGALLQVDQTSAPITYWDTWLSNGVNTLVCLGNNTNCPRDDGPDFLPGHGPYSANSDVGHNPVTAGPQYFHRDAGVVVPDPKIMAPGSKFSWVGLAIYIELNQ
jgi:hypothetical protein